MIVEGEDDLMETAQVLNNLLSKYEKDLKEHVVFSFRNTMEITVSSTRISNTLSLKYNSIVDREIFEQTKKLNGRNEKQINKEKIANSEKIENLFLNSFYHTENEKSQIKKSKTWWLSSGILTDDEQIVYIQIQFYN